MGVITLYIMSLLQMYEYIIYRQSEKNSTFHWPKAVASVGGGSSVGSGGSRRDGELGAKVVVIQVAATCSQTQR